MGALKRALGREKGVGLSFWELSQPTLVLFLKALKKQKATLLSLSSLRKVLAMGKTPSPDLSVGSL